MAWLARVLLALVALWLHVRVRWRGRAAVPSPRREPGGPRHWLAATRPWRAAEARRRPRRASTACAGRRAGRRVRGESAWIAPGSWRPAHLVITLGAWLMFGGDRAACAGAPVAGHRRGRRGRPVARRAAAVAWSRPDRAATGSASGRIRPPARLYVTVAFALFAWVLVAAGWSLAAQLGGRRATGVVLSAAGAVLACSGHSSASSDSKRRSPCGTTRWPCCPGACPASWA